MMQVPLPRRLFVAGHRGMVGSAICRRLANEDCNCITVDRDQLDLRCYPSVRSFLQSTEPDAIVFAAGRVGGIEANASFPVAFLQDNAQMATATIAAAAELGIARFLYLGSSCLYPRDARQPIPEEALLTGSFEATNEAYALGKLVGVKLCQFVRRQQGLLFHSVMPTNLYGPGDNYHPQYSHVLPGLLYRFHRAATEGASSVAIWGRGRVRREFLHVDDLADAVVSLLRTGEPPDWINVGSGIDHSVGEVAQQIAQIVGFQGSITHDRSRPEGVSAKRLDVRRIHELGWHHTIDLRTGLANTYQAMRSEIGSGRLRSSF